MDTLLSFLIPLSPIIINIICIIAQKGKIISLIATMCGAVPALLLLALNSGYGIGFGNPWIGVDWSFTFIYLAFIIVIARRPLPQFANIKAERSELQFL